MSYSDKTAIWFHKPTLMNQPLFQVPLLGYITGSQGLLLFGVGLPIFFLVMGSGGLSVALVPLAGAAALAMVRPPVVGYEGRLTVIIWFYLAKGRGGRPLRSGAFAVPVPSKGVAVPKDIRIKKPRMAAPEPVAVRATGRPVEISLRLRTRDNHVNRSKVRILLDGASIKTAVPSASGRVSVVLHPEDCAGTRRISVHEVTGDDRTGAMLTEKEVAFRG